MKEYLLVHSSKELPYLKHFKENKILIFENTKNRVLMEDINEYSNDIITRTKEIGLSKVIVELDFNKYTVQENDRYNSAIILATILRLDGFLNDIFLIGSKDIAKKSGLEITTKSYELLNLNVANYLTEKEAFQSAENKNISFLLQEIPEQHFDFNNFINGFELKPSKDRHQSTNEWGALKLALNSGYTQEEIDFSFPESLFFKFLLKKIEVSPLESESRENIVKEIEEEFKKKHDSYIELIQNKNLVFNELLNNKKILLIDDNAGKGWKAVLRNLFSNAEVHCDSSVQGVASQNSKGVFNKLNKSLKVYDLIFLDLYMPVIQTREPEMKNGMKVLKLIKESHPEIPVIVFTASNKSWTLDEILDLGADGMYVKESPDYVGDKKYSEGNFKSFVRTVLGALLKYQTLRPYWNAIQEILANTTIKEKDYQGNTTKFRERIEERLKMGYGLLKRGFEQRDYNKSQFYFSDYELSFITLWSIMNEISEASYDKTDSECIINLTDKNDKEYNCRPIPGYNWKIINTNDYLTKYHFDFDEFNSDGSPSLMLNSKPKLKAIDPKSYIVYDKKYKQYKLGENTRDNVRQELHNQIAFLILKSVNLKSSDEKEHYLKNLYRLNQVRNNLYLTHGDYIPSGFYDSTEQQKRGSHNITPNGDIKDLFELVGFLLTGNDIVLNLAHKKY